MPPRRPANSLADTTVNGIAALSAMAKPVGCNLTLRRALLLAALVAILGGCQRAAATKRQPSAPGSRAPISPRARCPSRRSSPAARRATEFLRSTGRSSSLPCRPHPGCTPRSRSSFWRSQVKRAPTQGVLFRSFRGRLGAGLRCRPEARSRHDDCALGLHLDHPGIVRRQGFHGLAGGIPAYRQAGGRPHRGLACANLSLTPEGPRPFRGECVLDAQENCHVF